MKKVLFVVGSNRSQSLNRQLAAEAEQLLQGRAEVSYLDFADVPFINQDDEDPVPAPVQRVRDEVSAADGIWLFSPEYNASYPGIVKNLFDWLSRPSVPGDFSSVISRDKRVTVSNAAGRSTGSGSRGKFLELARAIGMQVMDEPVCGVSLGAAFATNVLKMSDEEELALAGQADAFLAFLEQ